MTRTFPDDFIDKVICGDCLEVMKDIPDNSIDLIVTDPPYGRDYKSGRDVNNRFSKIANDKDNHFWLGYALDNVYKKQKDNTCAYVFTCWSKVGEHLAILERVGYTIKSLLVWEKPKNMGGMGDLEASYIHNYELIILCQKGRKILFKGGKGRQFSIIYADDIKQPLDLVHPNEKPLSLIAKFIETSVVGGGRCPRPISRFRHNRSCC